MNCLLPSPQKHVYLRIIRTQHHPKMRVLAALSAVALAQAAQWYGSSHCMSSLISLCGERARAIIFDQACQRRAREK